MGDKTKIQTEIELLSALDRGEVVTQMALSKRLSVSVGLVNALLKRVMHKGLVKARAAPYKRWAYYLTPRGFEEKSRLVAEYLEASLEFYRKARQEYRSLFVRGQECGFRKFVLVGRGEAAEIALLAAVETDVEVVGILDRGANTDHLNGLPVFRSLEEAGDWDALVITASRHPQEAYEGVRERATDQQLLAPPFLHVVRQPMNFEAPDVASAGKNR